MTLAAAIMDFISGMRGALHVTFEEGTHAAWLYDLLARRVEKLVVCNPRKNALLKSGNKRDAIDARKLAELLRGAVIPGLSRRDQGPWRFSSWRAVTRCSPKTPRV